MISRKVFQLRTPVTATRSDYQIKSNSSWCKCSELFLFLIIRKDIKEQISKTMAKAPPSTLLQRLKDFSLIQVPVEMSLQLVTLTSLTYVPVGTSLRRLKLVGFIYVPVRRCKNVSNRSVLLTCQMRHRDDVSAWSRTLILVTKMNQFYLSTRHFWYLWFFQHIRWFCLIKVPASTPLQRLKDVGLIQILNVISLPRFMLVSLTQVSIGTSLRRLKLVGFVYVPMRRRKDVSNRSVLFMYQLLRLDDVSAWSATFRPI